MSRKKIKGILIMLVVSVLCLFGCSKEKVKEEEKKTTIDYQAIYDTYVKQDVVKTQGISSISEVSFKLELDENSPVLATDHIEEANTGIIGRYIADLDKDHVPEMILSYVDNSDENKGTLVIEVYTIKDGEVVRVEGELQFEFFYNKCRGNLHVFLQEVDGETKLCVLKAFERSFGVLFYEMSFDVYCMEEGKIIRYAHEEMVEGDYGEQATQIAENVKEEVYLGEWFENEFKGEFKVPFEFELSTKDDSIVDVARIQATLDLGIQGFKYYDYSNMREQILFEDAYRELIEEKLIPEMGIASKSFNTWENLDMDSDECFGEISEDKLGLISSIEYDCNRDGTPELLVFYLKQEAVEDPSGGELIKQNLYIDLYKQKNSKAVFVGNVDVLEPVIPWSSVFAIMDSLSVSIKEYKENVYLYVERGCGNEGPVQFTYSVYNLTDMKSIKKCIYYMPIIDGARLNGELIIPAGTISGSSGQHRFIAKVENDEVELYYEEFDDKRDDSYEKFKFQTYEEAEEQVKKELLALGYDIENSDEERTEILSWYYEKDELPWVEIEDKTFLKTYVEVIQEEYAQQENVEDKTVPDVEQEQEDTADEPVPNTEQKQEPVKKEEADTEGAGTSSEGDSAPTEKQEMSAEEARKIAERYWNYTEGKTDEEGMEFGVFYYENSNKYSNGVKYYCFHYRAWIVDEPDGSGHWSTWDWVYVNSITGECVFEVP